MVTPDFGWAVGGSHFSTFGESIILHWDGKTWAEVPSPANYPLQFVWANSDQDGWILAGGSDPAAGFEGEVLRYVVPGAPNPTPTLTATPNPTSTPAPVLSATPVVTPAASNEPEYSPAPCASGLAVGIGLPILALLFSRQRRSGKG